MPPIDDTPNWEPLKRLLGCTHAEGEDHECPIADWVWLYAEHGLVRRVIQVYKHKITRKYLMLDEQGNAYRYSAGRTYTLMPNAQLALQYAQR